MTTSRHRLEAGCLAAAGALHLAMAPVHADESARQAVAFVGAGGAQLAVTAWLLVRPSGRAALAGVAVQVVALAAWAWSRRWGLPFDLGGQEGVATADGVTAGIEAAGVLLAVLRPRIPRLALGPALLAIAVVTGGVLADPDTAEHGGHGHDGETTDHAHDDEAAAAGCPEAGGDPVPRESTAAPRLSPAALDALAALVAASPPLPCGGIAAAGGHGHGDDAAPTERVALGADWDAAVAAAPGLTTREQAAAAGYVISAPDGPGVGAHLINWELIDQPFDPARPSMLLFDERPGRPATLAGFSYWVRSRTTPDGFEGDADVWHRHYGLCFVDGWLRREEVPSPDACEGDWLNGGDLWMLHAWVVPAYPNDAGPFAGRNELLCPADSERLADVRTCDPLR